MTTMNVAETKATNEQEETVQQGLGLPQDPVEILEGVLRARNWDVRDGQLSMVKTIGKAFPETAVTAPVGTGKTLGYLCGSQSWARRVIISTSTKALQTQIIGQELPELQQNLRDEFGHELSYMVLKGKSNYLDLKATAKLLRQHNGGPSSGSHDDDMDLLKGDLGDAEFSEEAWQILQEAYDNTVEAMESGDPLGLDQDEALASLPFKLRLAVCVDRYSTEANKKWPTGARENIVDEVIAKSRCAYRTAYAYAIKADILVVNTSLLASEIVKQRSSMSGLTPSFMPETDLVIIDEAHHTTDKFINALQVVHDIHDFEVSVSTFVDKMGNAGLSGELKSQIKKSLEKYVDDIVDITDQGKLTRQVLSDMAAELGSQWTILLAGISSANGDSKQLQILARVFKDDFIAMGLQQVSEKAISKTVESVAKPTHMISSRWRSSEVDNVSYSEDTPIITLTPVDLTSVSSEINWACREFQPYRRGTEEADEGGSAIADFSEFGGKGYIALCSGTMTRQAPSDIGMDSVHYQEVDSPFSAHSQKFFIPKTLPNPTKEQDDWLESAWGAAQRSIDRMDGRTLFLCTSNKSLRYFAEKATRYYEGDRSVFYQSRESNKRELIEAFRAEEDSILFGTIQSFGEGVDIPGSTLSLVIMDKINFPRPDDPTHKAKVESARRRGVGEFIVSTDAASVMMAQGAGRLIRSSACRGGVMILDPRLVLSNYGQKVMKLLPSGSEFTTKESDWIAYLDQVRTFIEKDKELPTKSFGGSWEPLSNLGKRYDSKKRQQRSTQFGNRRH